MANAKPESKSSPSSHRLSTHSQDETPEYSQDDNHDDIVQDLSNSVECKFDDLLKHFLYCILEHNSDEKEKLDKLQEKIEKLQSERYYGNVNGEDEDVALDGSPSQVPGDGAGTTTANIRHETARQGESRDDSANGTPEEKQLIAKRDTILQDLLERALDVVIPIANDADLRTCLETFGSSFKESETQRYTPYVELCNKALDRLENAAGNLPVRKKPDELNIRFQCSDPASILSRPQGTTADIERKPDVLISSRNALNNAHDFAHSKRSTKGRNSPDFALPPEKHFKLNWSVVLSCHEFKVHKKGFPEGLTEVLETRFTKDIQLEAQDHEKLLQADDLATEPNEVEVGQASASLKRRLLPDTGDGGPPSKKVRNTPDVTPTRTAAGTPSGSGTGSARKPELEEERNKQAVLGRVECASYALEMLSYSIGVHHAINILYNDDILRLWYYDRQGIMQSTGIKIFHDFPRFLLLLLIFQRFTQEDWGIIPTLNPNAVNGHKKQTSKVDSQDSGGDQNDVKNMPVIDLNNDLSDIKHVSNCWDKSVVPLSKVQLDTKKFLSPEPYCLAGRATAVIPSAKSIENGKLTEMVCKIYNPELQWRHEGLTMQVIYKIVEQNPLPPEYQSMPVLDHLPKFYFFGDVPRSTTNRIRSMVNRRWKGHRILRIIGMKRLHKLTTVSGWPFVKAWLDGVTCHAFLWRHFVEHGDPSLNNIMYDKEKKCGVLTDFDLSLLQWEPRIPGTDRTGTVPFMAIDLLSEDYWEGRIKRCYHHELESFIWILPFVFFTYINEERKPNALIDAWQTSDYNLCRVEKVDFLWNLRKARSSVTSDFEMCWTLAAHLCRGLLKCFLGRVERHGVGDNSFASAADRQLLDRQDSDELWDIFCDTVKNNLPKEEQQKQSFDLMLTRLCLVKPSFKLDDDMKTSLRDSYQNILYP